MVWCSLLGVMRGRQHRRRTIWASQPQPRCPAPPAASRPTHAAHCVGGCVFQDLVCLQGLPGAHRSDNNAARAPHV